MGRRILHPDFQNIFVAASSRKALVFRGTWDGTRWKNGKLTTQDGRLSYPVSEGIPNFILEDREDLWKDQDIREVREGDWIRRNWQSGIEAMGKKSTRTRFCKEMAEGDGLILEVAAGPGGGNAPGVLRFNPSAKILMNDLGILILNEWQAFLRDGRLGSNVSLAAFDATSSPIRNDSLDIVSGLGAFGNIAGTETALQEVFRVLRKGGRLFLVDGIIQEDGFSKLPVEVQEEWRRKHPCIGKGYTDLVEGAGFQITDYMEEGGGVIRGDESELGRIAQQHGVTLSSIGCRIRAEKL